MYKIKNLSKGRWFAIALASLAFLILLTALNPVSVNAQSAEEICLNKVNQEKCESDYRKECSNKDTVRAREQCVNNIKREYNKEVIAVCKGKSSASDCHKKVEDKCKDKNGNDKKKCQEDTAAGYKVSLSLGGSKGKYQCGTGPDAVKTRINFGCVGNNSTKPIGAIEDIAYAITRFLSYGVGLAVVISIIVAGVQYSSSEGNAETTQAAKNRIQSAVVGLVLYLFGFSLLQFFIPGGLFTS